ncbi:MAG TPA: alpha/beta fold hydrolase [Spirochaetia bacterium]|nr:alpha/beta fold hydrolase [Spirochaetia bacterium]
MNEQEMTISAPGVATPGALLRGTLSVPDAAAGPDGGKPPIVLIIAGSGPTDRDGNSPILPGRNDSLRMVAHALCENGIASLRFDKRGIGASVWPGLTEESLTLDGYALDAAAWIAQLRADGRFARLFVLGHSEGGLIASIAALNQPVDGEIVVATLGETYQDTLLNQLTAAAPVLAGQSRPIVAELVAGRLVKDVPEMLMQLFRPSVQPFLISAFRHNPADAIAAVQAPVLIVQGDRDLQVNPAHAELLSAARAALAAKFPTGKVIVPGMNHVLKDVAADRESNERAYSDPTLPVSQSMMNAVVAFVLRNTERKVRGAPFP